MPHPELYPLPDGVQGVPTQAELDAFPRKSTWEETRKMYEVWWPLHQIYLLILVYSTQNIGLVRRSQVLVRGALADSRYFRSDLIKLKRNPELQLRYDNWNIELKKQYGTVGESLLMKNMLRYGCL